MLQSPRREEKWWQEKRSSLFFWLVEEFILSVERVMAFNAELIFSREMIYDYCL